MDYKNVTKNAFNKIQMKALTHEMDANDFITRVNDTRLVIKMGIIESLFVVGDSVFATILRNHDMEEAPNGDQLSHGDGLFNTADRQEMDDVLVPEIAVLTNIDASNNKLDRFLGKHCKVLVRNEVAIFAEVLQGEISLTSFPAEVIRATRMYLGVDHQNIFSEKGKEYLREKGYTNEEIEELAKFKYKPDSMSKKINTFLDEATWFKDTSKQQENENIIEPPLIVKGLLKLGMKSKECHIPTRIFSGK